MLIKSFSKALASHLPELFHTTGPLETTPPTPITPRPLIFTCAVLTLSGLTRHDFQKLIPMKDREDNIWVLAIFKPLTPSEHTTIPGVNCSSHEVYHGSKVAGIIGVLKATKTYRESQPPPPIPLQPPIIYPSAGFYDTQNRDPFQAFFGLYFESGAGSSQDSHTRSLLLDTAIKFGKNQCDILIRCSVDGLRENIKHGGAWGAQDAIRHPQDANNPTIIASLKSYKAAIKASHAIPNGILFKLTNMRLPSNWSPSHPFNMASS